MDQSRPPGPSAAGADVVVNYRSLSIRDMTIHRCPVLATIVVVVTVALAVTI